MPTFKVEVWEIQSYQMEVDADSADDAETEANRILQEMSPERYGAAYDDRWLDVMNAEPCDGAPLQSDHAHRLARVQSRVQPMRNRRRTA